MSTAKKKSKGRAASAEGGTSCPSTEIGSITLTVCHEKDVDKVPKSYRSSLAQLGLNSMKSAGICIGRPVLLTSSIGRQEVCIAWPVSGFPSGKIGLSGITQRNLKVKPGEEVLVEPLTGPVLQAEEIGLTLRKSMRVTHRSLMEAPEVSVSTVPIRAFAHHSMDQLLNTSH